MGTSSSAAELIGKITKASSDLQKSQARTIGAAARESKTIIEAQMGVATGDRRLSGKRNARVGVRYKVYEGRLQTVANVRAYGPAHLIERPTSAHVITSRYGGGSRRSRQGGNRIGGGRRAVLNIPGVGYRRRVRHPGTAGKYPFRKGTELSIPKVRRVVRTGTFNAGLGAFN